MLWVQRHEQLASPPIRVTIPDAGRGRRRNGEFRPGALGPASRLRRRYADAPASAPLRAPSAPAAARRRFPPASKSGLLAAFFFLWDRALVRCATGISERCTRTHDGGSDARQTNLQTTNLGVGSSNLSERTSNTLNLTVFYLSSYRQCTPFPRRNHCGTTVIHVDAWKGCPVL